MQSPVTDPSIPQAFSHSHQFLLTTSNIEVFPRKITKS